MTSTEIEANSGFNQGEFTITFEKNNFSQIKGPVLSPPHMIHDLSWRIMIKPTSKIDEDTHTELKSLGFFLQCNADAENFSWTCYAKAHLTVVSQRADTNNFTRKIQHLFYAKEDDWGFSHFMPWNDVINPKNGFIRNDTVIFQVVVFADLPHGITSNCQKSTNNVGLKNQETI